MFLSIIVPVYKVEEYLPACVESVFSQSFDDYEVILVDDGSPDGSGALADGYAAGRENVRVIHKENGGLSDARNAGIKMAEGEYVMFLDADDCLEGDCLEGVAEDIRSAADLLDICFFDVMRQNPDGSFRATGKRGIDAWTVMTGTEALREEISEGRKFCAMAPSGVYRRKFLVDNALFFRAGILHEDEDWTPVVMLAADRVMKSTRPYYRYFVRESSITRAADKTRNARDLLGTCARLKTLYEGLEDEGMRKALLCYVAKLYLRAESVLIRAGEEAKPDPDFFAGRGVSAKDRIRFAAFRISPTFYAKVVDPAFIS